MSFDRRSFLKYLGVAGASVGAGIVALENVTKDGIKNTLLGTSEAQADTKGSVGTQNYDVKPGELDSYYGFWSGGHSGEVRILGVPSMRELKRIPVFNMDVGSGYGVTNESKALLKGRFCGDTHHVHGSYKDGIYDAKYLFVNDKLNNRVARIRMDYMEVDKIVDVPNIQGMHGLFTQRFPKTDWVVCNGEFQVPVPNSSATSTDAPSKYYGIHSIIDAEKMEVVCQIMMDENMDLAATDYGGKYSMTTSYNTEKGVTVSEMLANDNDAMLVFNWERIRKALSANNYKMINGVKVIDGREGKSDIVLRIPIPKNPHGINVTPDGKYAICSGKVAPICSVVEIAKLDEAFSGKIKPKDCIVAQPYIGLGPLHTTYDGRGNAYTSVFIDSTNVKWNIQKAIDAEKLGAEEKKKNAHIIDVLDIHYQVGHIMASMAETKEADGKWLISLNKFSKDRFLNVGPAKNECEQLIDISGEKLKLVHDSAIYIEPHDCIIVRRDIVEKVVKDRYNMFEHPLAVTKSGVERKGNKVTVKLTANAPVFGLQEVKLKKGDDVTVIVTNNDEISDLGHGFALSNYNINFVVSPFQTKSVTFKADKPGVHWAYCTNFCHALHLEMRMRFIIT
ncbi:TAT-dependent nitrous-oxide reductase [Candidatus Magnetomonas plexicatena]|uniref:TAT-dependent nitrous-oxide reductase n=1 Tax=Candidatus Magnetomonas plexicatena TaxID=2552947 RepID=UPI001C746B81|nr:nitrous-oxide reductase [Nitrospirales bacterium LBB_01]